MFPSCPSRSASQPTSLSRVTNRTCSIWSPRFGVDYLQRTRSFVLDDGGCGQRDPCTGTPSAWGLHNSAADFFRKIELLEGQGEQEVANDGQEKEKMKGKRRHDMEQES
jgi:hypothetical protein